MPFERPTLPELITRIAADFKSRLDFASSALRRSLRYVLTRVIAGAVHMLHGHLEYLGRQIFADISDDEYLVRQASLYGLSKSAATYAEGSVLVTGDEGTPVLEGTILRRADGAEFTVTNDFEIDVGDEVEVTVRAVLAGDDANTDEDTVLTFESPVSGADAEVTVTEGGLTGGADEETTEALRTRLLQHLQNPPEGGAEEDYRTWALDVAGVTRVWVDPRADGAGTVTVRFMRDSDSGSAFPSAGEVTEVQDYIDTKRPVTADVTVLAPTAKTWNFTLQIIPDTADTRAAVQAELADLFLREGEPGETLYLSAVRTAIGSAEGITDFTLTIPSSNLTHAGGELPTVGSFTWT
jgi:uncharacterized phage protein gp47/JayE